MKKTVHTILKTGSLLSITAIILFTGCQQPKPDASKELKPLVDKFVEVWNTGNVEELDAIFDPQFIRHANSMESLVGLDNLKKLISGFRTSYPDLKISLEDAIFSENKSSGRWTLTGTNTGPGEMPPTGKAVKVWGLSSIRYSNGKIAEEWVAYDNESFKGQLGFMMMPPSSPKK